MQLDIPDKIKLELFEEFDFLKGYIANQDLDRWTNPSYPPHVYSSLLKKLKLIFDEIPEEDQNEYKHSGIRENIEKLSHAIKVGEEKLKNKAQSLNDFSIKLKAVIRNEIGANCWLYINENGVFQPYLIRSIEYRPKTSHNDRAYVTVSLSSRESNKAFSIDSDDMRSAHKDPSEWLSLRNIYFEKPEYLEAYREREKDFYDKREMQAKQFLYRGKKYINDDVYSRTNGKYDDEDSHRYGHTNNRKSTTSFLSSEFSMDGELQENPWKCMINMFDLGEHKFVSLPTFHLDLYEYDDSIEKKLVLPEDHKDLIDILLTDDIKNLEGGDIIEGKGTGTLILSKGSAGLGKTATAEVYSEKQKLPIYSVHSGQLGTKGDSIEKVLKVVFERSERWGCILLIDEADVYIRKRDNDVNHNAIVATFLRTMEYYKGTMFMTTNRLNDVDEAIESRCTAILRYELPDNEMSKKLWRLFASQFKLEVSDETLETVQEKFGPMSGRDIKNITMLANKYSTAKQLKEVTVKEYELCGLFRGKISV